LESGDIVIDPISRNQLHHALDSLVAKTANPLLVSPKPETRNPTALKNASTHAIDKTPQ
jgi:hypothetical protein